MSIQETVLNAPSKVASLGYMTLGGVGGSAQAAAHVAGWLEVITAAGNVLLMVGNLALFAVGFWGAFVRKADKRRNRRASDRED